MRLLWAAALVLLLERQPTRRRELAACGRPTTHVSAPQRDCHDAGRCWWCCCWGWWGRCCFCMQLSCQRWRCSSRCWRHTTRWSRRSRRQLLGTQQGLQRQQSGMWGYELHYHHTETNQAPSYAPCSTDSCLIQRRHCICHFSRRCCIKRACACTDMLNKNTAPMRCATDLLEAHTRCTLRVCF